MRTISFECLRLLLFLSVIYIVDYPKVVNNGVTAYKAYCLGNSIALDTGYFGWMFCDFKRHKHTLIRFESKKLSEEIWSTRFRHALQYSQWPYLRWPKFHRNCPYLFLSLHSIFMRYSYFNGVPSKFLPTKTKNVLRKLGIPLHNNQTFGMLL